MPPADRDHRYPADDPGRVLKRITVNGVAGLLMAVVVAAAIAVLDQAGPLPSWMRFALGIVAAVSATLAMLNLLTYVVMWCIYRWRRSDIDAGSAELVNEFNARMDAEEHPRKSAPVER